MADANIRINVETSSLEQLNAELAKLQAEIKNVPVGSAEFKRLSAEVRRVDGAVEGANKKLKSFDVGQLVGNVAKVGAAVASASALFKEFGAEGSSSNEQIQSALETTNTILGAAAIAEGIAAAGQVAYTVATEGATIAQEFFAVAVGTSTGALQAFKVALVTTGIGALIVGLGLLISAFMDSKDAAEASKAAIEELGKEYERLEGYLSKQSAYNKIYEAEELKRAQLQKKSAKEVNDIKSKYAEKERQIIISLQTQNQKRLNESLSLEFKTADEKRKADDAVAKAKKQGLENLTKEERTYYERITKYQDAYTTKANELQIRRAQLDAQEKQNSLDLQLEAQRKYEEAVQKAEAAAQERRNKLKADLNEITDILKEQSVSFSIKSVDAEYKKLIGIVDGLKKQTKDYKTVLKELEKEGFKPFADLLRETFGKDLKGNFDEIKKAIDESFSKQRLGNVQGFLDEIGNKFKEYSEESTAYIDDLLQSLTFTGEGFSRVTNIIGAEVDKQTGDVKRAIIDVQNVAYTVDDVLQDIDINIKGQIRGLQENAAEQVALVRRLESQGLLTPEAALQFLDKINQAYDKGIKQLQAKQKTSIQSVINTLLTAVSQGIQDNLSSLNNQLSEVENKFLKDVVGKNLIKRLKLEQEFNKKKFTITQAGILAEQLAVDSAQSKLKQLRKDGLISEEDYIKEKEKLEKQFEQTVLKAEKNIQLDRQRRTAESLAIIQAYFEQVQKYYQVLATSLQAIGNILADQAALQDLRFEEEIQKVQEIYDKRFKLIDEEEKKLDDLEQAKETNLSRTERKRRALARERTSLEAQQVEELAQLENDRANAAADAAIKQANVNFALAVGQIAISTAEAIIKAVAESPLTGGLPFSAFAAAAGAIQLAAANSARTTAIAQAEASRPGVSGAKNVRVSKAEGGLITGPGNAVSDSVPVNLSNGEFVVNANATRQFLPLLNQINQSGLQGGNPVNASGFSDPVAVALLQEIKTQLAQPNRSYVVYNDIENIQNKQNYINRRSNVL